MARRQKIIGLALLSLAMAGESWAQSPPLTPQQAAEIEAVRQMQQDEADQQAEYDRMEAEQADSDRAEAERADMRRLEREAQRRTQQSDMDAADELAREMDAADGVERDSIERENAETAAEWARTESGREASCRIMLAGAVQAIRAQYAEKIQEVQADGGDHVAEQVSNLLQARDNVIASLIDEQCMAPHERRAREENRRRLDQVRDGSNQMPPFQRNADGSIGPAPRR